MRAQRPIFVRSAAVFLVLALYAVAIPFVVLWLDSDYAILVSQLGVVPFLLALVGIQLLVVARAMYADPGAKGCRSCPSTPESWKAPREIVALVVEGLQHLSIAFASEVSWNPQSGLDAFTQLFSLTARRRWFGPPPFPAAISGVAAIIMATLWLLIAGYTSLSLRVMWDIKLRQSLPLMRADTGIPDRLSEGPAVLLLGTTAYLAVVAGLLRQLHCAPTPAPIEELGGGDRNADAPRETVLPRLWDDAEGLVHPTLVTECWSPAHIPRAEVAMGLLLLYTITSAVLAPFFSQPRHPTVLLSDPADSFTKYTAQPGVRRSYKFDAIARLCKLLFAIVAVFGRAEPAFTLPVALCGNALLAVLARTRWCRPTNHELLNVLWTGVYGAAAWTAAVAWMSYLVAAPTTWGTVGVLLVGWVVGGVTLGNRYLAKTALLRGVLRVEEEDWRIAPSA